MADRFETFAREECSHGSPMGVTSPTYALLSRAVASDPELLDIALECKVGPPIPNLFFAAVKRAVADRPDSELGLLYRRIAGGGPPTADLGKCVRRVLPGPPRRDCAYRADTGCPDQRDRSLLLPDAGVRRRGRRRRRRATRAGGRWRERGAEPAVGPIPLPLLQRLGSRSTGIPRDDQVRSSFDFRSRRSGRSPSP